MVAAQHKVGKIARRHRVSAEHVSVTTFIAIIKSTTDKNIKLLTKQTNKKKKIHLCNTTDPCRNLVE